MVNTQKIVSQLRSSICALSLEKTQTILLKADSTPRWVEDLQKVGEWRSDCERKVETVRKLLQEVNAEIL